MNADGISCDGYYYEWVEYRYIDVKVLAYDINGWRNAFIGFKENMHAKYV